MQRNDNLYRAFAVAGLVIGVIALTIGFAAFNQSLTISSSAEVDVADTPLDIAFSTSQSSQVNGSVTPTASGNTGASGSNATFANTTISGLHAIFTKPGQTVTYSFYVRNDSAYTAYLNTVDFANAANASAFKVCSAGSDSTQSYVDNACNGISITVTTGTYSTSDSVTTGGTGHSLAATTGETVTVEITYADGSATADGDFDVSFGDITLGYSTIQET